MTNWQIMIKHNASWDWYPSMNLVVHDSGYDGLWANRSFEELGIHPALVTWTERCPMKTGDFLQLDIRISMGFLSEVGIVHVISLKNVEKVDQVWSSHIFLWFPCDFPICSTEAACCLPKPWGFPLPARISQISQVTSLEAQDVLRPTVVRGTWEVTVEQRSSFIWLNGE